MSIELRKSIIPPEVAARYQVALAEDRSGIQPDPPSQRTPKRSRHLNPADMIEEQMQACGHEIAGYVVYRTTCGSDADWKQFLARLNAALERVFNRCNGRDILDKFPLTIMEDRELYNAASTDAIRQHFQRWSAQNYLSEQPHTKDPEDYAYRYALCVDAESLHSVIRGEDGACDDDGWVKVIRSEWSQDSGDDEDDDGEPQDPLEGVTRHDVGWMKVALSSLVQFYEYGYDLNYWISSYQRPPEILSV